MTHSRLPCTSERLRVVLLVEDEPFVRDATCRTLESAGFEVLTAGNAEEAMVVYQKRHGKIDLLMTDMGLPGRTGRQLSQELRNSSAEIPIVLTSGYVENQCDVESQEPGTHFLPKPYSRAELFALIGKIFGVEVRRLAATQAS